MVDVEDAVAVVVPLDQPEVAGRAVRAELVAEDRGRLVLVDVHEGDVGVDGHPAGEQVAQHPDHRRDAGAGGDQQQLARDRGRQHELALGLLQLEHLAGLGAVHQVVGDDAAGDRLDGEAQVAVAARAVGQRVGAPQAYAVDVDPDPDVLAGHVAGPVAARLHQDGGGLGGLRGHRDDAPAQAVFAAAAQRVEDVEDVGELERGDRGLGDPAQRAPQGRARGTTAGRPGGGDRCHVTRVPYLRAMIHDQWT